MFENLIWLTQVTACVILIMLSLFSIAFGIFGIIFCIKQSSLWFSIVLDNIFDWIKAYRHPITAIAMGEKDYQSLLSKYTDINLYELFTTIYRNRKQRIRQERKRQSRISQ